MTKLQGFQGVKECFANSIGLVSGTGPQPFEYGGRLDGFVKLDTEKLGLWKGGGLTTHLEYRFGALPGSLGGSFFPTNAGMAFPTDSRDTLVATSLYLSQKFGDRASLLIGKINILDLVDDPFFGGGGIHRFWNTVFVAPPSGLVPSTLSGTSSIGFQFSHLFHQNPSNPKQGWGLFLKGSLSDGNPNYVQNSIYGGLGGTGLFPGRELDSFGLGYFYYNLSNALEGSFNDLSPGASFGDEQGVEVYYSYALTPWFYITGDLQYIAPPRNVRENAFIAALRANIRF